MRSTPIALLVLLASRLLSACGGVDRDPCAGVACSGHGACVEGALGAECACDPGFAERGLSCVAPCPGGPDCPQAAQCSTDADCDDSLSCNGAESCDPEGLCQPGTAVECGPVPDCAEARCDEALDRCVVDTYDERCADDASFCAGVPTCDPAAGCVPGAPPDCSDGVACTDDACRVDLQACVSTPRHDRCGPGELCDAATGCGVAPCQSDDDCAGPALACDGVETCGAEGVCVPGAPPACDVPHACAVGLCDEGAGGCLLVPVDAACDDGDPCTGVERCDVARGCVSPEPVQCDDGLSCTDDACDAGECRHVVNVPPPVGAPRPTAPQNGARTGSLHAAAMGTLRPTFRWQSVALDGEAATYELELEDDCPVRAPADCAFSSPMRATALAGTEWTPADDLPVSDVAPVGTRWVWRVRACRPCTGECGPWSQARSAEIGRVPADVDGDGRTDVVASAFLNDALGNDNGGRVYVFYADPATGQPELTPGADLPNPLGNVASRLGYAVTTLDLDGDGFADVAASAQSNNWAGVVYVWLGSTEGPVYYGDIAIGIDLERFGTALSTAGDVDADGYEDLLVGAYAHTTADGRANEGAAYLYRGASEATLDFAAPATTLLFDGTEDPDARFGGRVAGGGDLDGDGYSDVAVGAWRADDALADAGVVRVYRGGPAGLDATPTAILSSPDTSVLYFGWSLAMGGDLDGDGLSDLVVGAPGQYEPQLAHAAGAAYVYRGREAGIADGAAPDATLANPGAAGALGMFGWRLAMGGDVTGDGRDDLVVGAPWHDSVAAIEVGEAFVFAGAAGGIADDAAPSFTLRDAREARGAAFGFEVGVPGDVDADGIADVIVGAVDRSWDETREGGVLFFRGAPAFPEWPTAELDNPADEATGSFGGYGLGVY